MSDLFRLSSQVPIVDPKTGCPTLEFQRVLQKLSLADSLTLGPGGAIDIAGGAITNAMLAQMASATVKANKEGAAGEPEDLTLTQLLDLVTGAAGAAQGDILYRDAASWKRLAAGASGQFLETQGVGANPKWATGGGTMTLIQSISPGGTPTASFTAIPNTYKSLRISGFGRSAGAGTSAIASQLRCNSDAGANYNWQRIISNGSGNSAEQKLGQTSMLSYELARAGCLANVASAFEIIFPNYAGTTFYKSLMSRWLNPGNGTTNTTMFWLDGGGYWASTAAINQIDCAMTDGSNWAAGSRVDLYGIS